MFTCSNLPDKTFFEDDKHVTRKKRAGYASKWATDCFPDSPCYKDCNYEERNEPRSRIATCKGSVDRYQLHSVARWGKLQWQKGKGMIQ